MPSADVQSLFNIAHSHLVVSARPFLQPLKVLHHHQRIPVNPDYPITKLFFKITKGIVDQDLTTAITHGDDLAPLEVHLVRSAPEDNSPLDDFFGCSVTYGEKDNRRVFRTMDV